MVNICFGKMSTPPQTSHNHNHIRNWYHNSHLNANRDLNVSIPLTFALRGSAEPAPYPTIPHHTPPYPILAVLNLHYTPSYPTIPHLGSAEPGSVEDIRAEIMRNNGTSLRRCPSPSLSLGSILASVALSKPPVMPCGRLYTPCTPMIPLLLLSLSLALT